MLRSIHKRVRSLADAAARKAARKAKHAKGRALAGSQDAAGEADLSTFQVEHILGKPEADLAAMTVQSASVDGAAAGPGSGGAAARIDPRTPGGGRRRRPPHAAVLVVSPQLEGRGLIRAMSAAPGVRAVAQDRVISIAAEMPVAGERALHPCGPHRIATSPTALGP
jgi:hypothetical protein